MIIISTARRTWKKYETRVAHAINTERTPLSGENSRITSSDTLHNDYYVEVKMRDSINKFLAKLMRDTIEEAKEKSQKEDKDWIIVFKEKYKKKDYALVNWNWLLDLMEKAGEIDE